MSGNVSTTSPFSKKLDSFPDRVRLETSLADFDTHGNLPPGDYAPDEFDFKRRFVDSRAESESRAQIYADWNDRREALVNSIGVPAGSLQLLDGSFVSSKTNPKDIDFAVEIPVTSADEMVHHAACTVLTGPGGRCDAYPIFRFPRDHDLYTKVTERGIQFWTKVFGTDRSGRSKGRLWMPLGPSEA